MSTTGPQPDIMRDDDGAVMVTFGGGTQAAALAAAFADVPADAWVMDITTTWFSEQEDCQGQDLPDDDHCFPVTCVALLPEVIPPGRPDAGPVMDGPLTAEEVERYLHADCVVFALAVSALTGWPAVQITEGDDPDNLLIRHALVRMPDGRLLDAAGPHDDYSGWELFDAVYWDCEQTGPDTLVGAMIAEAMTDAGRVLAGLGWQP
jgi:hypothetical protein